MISKALTSLGITGWTLQGSPANEAEFLAMFSKVIGVDADGNAIESTDPADWGFNIADVFAKVDELKAEEPLRLLRAKRAAEYPPMEDYLDAIVKGDEAQKQAYIDACLAVKTKYPKV